MDYEEKIFYNAVAIALEGNPSEVRVYKKKVAKREGLFANWKRAYELLVKDGRSPPINPELEWKKMQAAGARLIFFSDEDYPEALKHIHHPPVGIYVRGKLPERDSVCFSIVGTRRATTEGKSITKQFAGELAEAGFVIVSGLALGIDAAAHVGCLDANGTTIAVLACGLDDIYPSENEKLGVRILETGGAIISEYPIGQPSYPGRFLERNRIVSGLSRGVLIVECPDHSGSRATGRLALEQNRDVFVVPGPISHPNFFGSHQLIRQGAELVTKPEDILESYNIFAENKMINAELATSAEEKQVMLALQSTSHALDVDKIIDMTKLEPRVANQALSFLLLKHLVTETETGYIIE
jgi:DNA processing protein